MLRLKKLAIAMLALFAPMVFSATISPSGVIENIDGDQDGLVDDLIVALVSFEVTEAGTVIIDSDVVGFDAYMYVFNDLDQTIAQDDDDGFDPDPYLSMELSEGIYRVAIGAFGFNPSDGLQEYKENWSYSSVNEYGTSEVSGTWALEISGVAATQVPVPAALPFFLSALTSLLIFRRKRS